MAVRFMSSMRGNEYLTNFTEEVCTKIDAPDVGLEEIQKIITVMAEMGVVRILELQDGGLAVIEPPFYEDIITP